MGPSRLPFIANALLIVGITLALLWGGGDANSSLRHLYFLPVLWGAIQFGVRGGSLSALFAILAYAPILLPAVERQGPSAEVGEGLITVILLLSVGSLTGRFADHAQIESGRYRTLSELQRALKGGGELPELLERAATLLLKSQAVHQVSLLLRLPEGEQMLLVVNPDDSPLWLRGEALPMNEQSAAGWAIQHRRLVYLPDLSTDHRLQREPGWTPVPRRAVLIPLLLADECLGLLVIERHGEFGRDERNAAMALGLEIALGIEHARLTLRQRRFAEELETKVEAATQHLRELDQAKSDFVSMASHELRTPLTSIQGFTELLLTRDSPAERTRQFLQYIHREALRLGRIVSDLLDLSRIEMGRTIELRRTAVCVPTLFERNISLLQSETSQHRLIWDAESGLPEIDADPEKVDQIIQNLLSNAIKYSPSGGTIRLSASRSSAPGFVEVAVADEGMGIPPEALSRIFEKYYRVADPMTAQVRGLGLGLSLVKTLVGAHAGEIRVSSEVGKGSCFLLTFPEHRPTPPKSEESTAPEISSRVE